MAVPRCLPIFTKHFPETTATSPILTYRMCTTATPSIIVAFQKLSPTISFVFTCKSAVNLSVTMYCRNSWLKGPQYDTKADPSAQSPTRRRFKSADFSLSSVQRVRSPASPPMRVDACHHIHNIIRCCNSHLKPQNGVRHNRCPAAVFHCRGQVTCSSLFIA